MSAINAVFEGGGVRAIAHVGAIKATEQRFDKKAPDLYGNLAGTSGGAVIAGLLACGYDAAGLNDVMRSVDYTRFQDKDWLEEIPLVGLAVEEGLYKGDFLYDWIRECFAKLRGADKPELTFGDLKNDDGSYRLQIIASDITRGQKLVLPRDMKDFEDYTPDTLPVALAVRMSSSIPFFFKPMKLNSKTAGTCIIVDGGLLSDYPLDLVSADQGLTIGYRLVAPNSGKPNTIHGPVSMLEALFSTMMTGYDNFYIDDNKFRNTIAIETFGKTAAGVDTVVNSTDFGLGTAELDMLYANGLAAAAKFLDAAGADLVGTVSAVSRTYSRHEKLRPAKG